MLLFISLSTFAAADFNLNPNYLWHHMGSVLQIIIWMLVKRKQCWHSHIPKKGTW